MSKNKQKNNKEVKKNEVNNSDTKPVGVLPENTAEDDQKTRIIDLNQAEQPKSEEAVEVVESKAEAVETKAEETAEKAETKTNGEQEYSAAEGTDASLLSEFAPKPINIPNVDLEKEKKKQEKRRQQRDKEVKKVAARKSKSSKKASMGKKVAVGIAGFLLFVLLTGAMTGLISVVSLHASTSKLAFKTAVRNMEVQEISLGRIKNYDELGLVKSSSNAALIDIIRDNSDVAVTYKEINSAVRSSGVDDFIAENMKNAVDYLLKGTSYEPITEEDIVGEIRSNATLVRNLTSKELTDEDYSAIAAHFAQDGNLEEISREALDKTPLRSYTDMTRHAMSMTILGALLLLALALIIVICVVCRGSSYIPVGWAFIVSGILVVLAAVLFAPVYGVSSPFLQTVIDRYFSFFKTSVIVSGAIFTVIGAIIFLVGSGTADRDE